jgi:hypothetical protein
MARASEDVKDKALWIMLAQSWVRLADHVAHAAAADGAGDESVIAAQSAD